MVETLGLVRNIKISINAYCWLGSSHRSTSDEAGRWDFTLQAAAAIHGCIGRPNTGEIMRQTLYPDHPFETCMMTRNRVL